ncbi:MAG: GTPase HflX [Candidatus Gracilibacteria bacterium]|nr:GTPase HflX [Candidatus Gracilibacteria bacterium]
MGRQKSERELEQIQDKIEYAEGELKVFVADILPKELEIRQNMQDRMKELENLVNTYGGVVIVKHIQNKSVPDYNTFIGEGRLDEIIEEMQKEEANVLILGNILKAQQIYKINEKLRPIGAKAWDRVDLILKIFEKNAHSAEAKLQIELAAVKHMGPRIFGMGMELSKQGGGVGTRGKGETNTEIMKRHLAKKEQHIRKELDHYAKVREQHRQGRKRKGMQTIGVVGYTNAGKSTLTNALTKKGVLAEDKLFATLGTSVGKMFIEAKYNEETGAYIPPREILVNDTIGFIRELPPKLIDAFTSTLEDSIESDLLLHVIDTSDEKFEIKIKVVEEILTSIGAKQKSLYVFNKIDELDNGEYIIDQGKESEKKYNSKKEYILEKYSEKENIFISASKKENIEILKEKIIEALDS